MKINKWINIEQEVELDINAEDLSTILLEEDSGRFAEVNGFNVALNLLGRVASVLRGIPDTLIKKMNESQLETISEFLTKQTKRYSDELELRKCK